MNAPEDSARRGSWGQVAGYALGLALSRFAAMAISLLFVQQIMEIPG